MCLCAVAVVMMMEQLEEIKGADPEVMETGEAADGQKLPHVRGAATKRLLFSRLPPLLCIHLCRRVREQGGGSGPAHKADGGGGVVMVLWQVFSGSLGRMTKNGVKVTFPLLLDLSHYSLYGGVPRKDTAATG